MFRLPLSLAALLAVDVSSFMADHDRLSAILPSFRTLGPGRRNSTRIRTGTAYPHSSTRQQVRYARQIAAGQLNMAGCRKGGAA